MQSGLAKEGVCMDYMSFYVGLLNTIILFIVLHLTAVI